MHSSIRSYKADPNDKAAILSIVKSGNIQELINGIPGFIAYYIVDSGEDTVTTISVFEDQAGADRSTELAGQWVKENVLPSYSISPPEVTSGEVILSA